MNIQFKHRVHKSRKEKDIEIRELKKQLNDLREKGTQQEIRHKENCANVMDFIRGRYYIVEPFQFNSSSSVTCTHRQTDFSHPHCYRWSYNVDVNLIKQVDSKQLLEQFIYNICNDIRHMWIKEGV